MRHYLSRLKALLGRLLAAIRRRGVIGVALMLLAVVRSTGVRTVLRLVVAGRPLPHDEQLEQRLRPPVVPEGPPEDLDDDFLIRASDWAQWRKVLGVHPPSPDPRDEKFPPANISVVVRGEGAEALEKTRAALGRLGATVEMLEPGADFPSGDRFVLFLQAGDVPDKALPKALARAARAGVTEVVSFDMFRRVGTKVQPMALPGTNPTLLGSADYVFSRIALRGSAAPRGKVGPVDPRALVLDWMQDRPPNQIRGRWRHIARPLLEAQLDDEAVAAEREAARKAPAPRARTAPKGVSAVICTKDKGHLLRQLVNGLLQADRATVEDVVIVANNTTNPYALEAHAELARSPRVRLLRSDEPFNFSRLTNAGARETQGDGPILLLNDDIVPVTADWLERLQARLQAPGVGCVGPLLLFPDESVQHAGMFLGRGGPQHTLRGARLPEQDYLFQGCGAREVTSLTGAVLLTSRSLFEALGGLDEQLALHLQDVDYCLRAKAAGFANVFEPASILLHMESVSVNALKHTFEFQRRRYLEHQHFVQRWGAALAQDALHPAGFEDDRFRRLSGPAGERPAPSKR